MSRSPPPVDTWLWGSLVGPVCTGSGGCGPGASHEDRTKPQPKKGDPRAPGSPTNSRHSRVSGGGGERDVHHAHDPKAKGDFEDRHPRDGS